MNKTLLLGALLLGAGCGGGPGTRQAAEFNLPDLSGKLTALSSFRGKPVLVNFWATWCDSCREEMPDLEALHRRRSPEGFILLGLSIDEDASKVPPFVQKFGLTFPVLFSDKKTSQSYAVRGLPTAFLIDAEGRVARRWVGPLDARAVENDILALLNRRPL
ncbi:MAG: TlpA disulfide reductase family protein [Elusimicrobiota bacterium]